MFKDLFNFANTAVRLAMNLIISEFPERHGVVNRRQLREDLHVLLAVIDPNVARICAVELAPTTIDFTDENAFTYE